MQVQLQLSIKTSRALPHQVVLSSNVGFIWIELE